MFLNRLSMQEKENFISLAMKAAESNGMVVEEEYSMIEEYCKEMGIAFFDARNVKEVNDIVAFFRNSSLANKKTVLLEMIGLMYADGDYDEDERQFVKSIATGIGLTNGDVEKYDGFILKYISLVKDTLEDIQL